MWKKLSEEELRSLTQAAAQIWRNVTGTEPSAEGPSLHVGLVRICDRCQDEGQEAFPYCVVDTTGRRWQHLCNQCFDELQPTTFYEFDDVGYVEEADW